MTVTLNVNGQDHTVDAEPDTPLLYVLRNDLGLNGAKFGCGLGQCGACTVIIDGHAAFSCTTPILMLEGAIGLTLKVGKLLLSVGDAALLLRR